MQKVNNNNASWIPTRKVTAAAAGGLIVLFFQMVSAEFGIEFKPETWQFIGSIAPVVAGYLMPEGDDDEKPETTEQDVRMVRQLAESDFSIDATHIDRNSSAQRVQMET